MFEALTIVPRPDQVSNGVPPTIDWNGRWQGLVGQQRIRDALQEQHDLARRNLRHYLNGIYLKHAEQGDFKSGAIMNFCVDAFEEHAENLIESLVQTWERLAPSPETYALVTENAGEFLSLLDDELGAVALRVERETENALSVAEGILVAKRHWTKKCERFLERLEERFFEYAARDETMPPAPALGREELDLATCEQETCEQVEFDRNDVEQEKVTTPSDPLSQDLWLDIALQLWTGELRPGSRNELDQAMTEWFDRQGVTYAEAEVQEASHRLWRKYVATRRIITKVALPAGEEPDYRETAGFDRLCAPQDSGFSVTFADDGKPVEAQGDGPSSDHSGLPQAFNLGMEPKIELAGLAFEVD
jgi:hypothetical protein